MSNPRPILLIALLFVGYLLFNAWQEDYGPQSRAKGTLSVSATENPSRKDEVPITPDIAAAASSPTPPLSDPPTPSATFVDVVTDVLRVRLSSRGGDIVHVDLLTYPVDPKDKDTPVQLLDDHPETFYVAQSGLISADSPAPNHRAEFQVEKASYQLDKGETELRVILTWRDATSGIDVQKSYLFRRGSYLIEMQERINNPTSTNWSGREYRQLQRVGRPPAPSGLFAVYNADAYAFTGAAWYSAVDKFNKLAFDKFATNPLHREEIGGWIAMLQHYFVSSWIPTTDERNEIQTEILSVGNTPRYLIRSQSPVFNVPPKQESTITTHLYIGPKIQSDLATIAPGLELTADYGVLTIVAQPLHWVLLQLHKVVGNWGLAIILLVLLLKLALYKPSEIQFRAAAKMKQLQPRLQALKERYGDDKAKYQQAMLELQQKEKINPLGGCLPMIIQIPLFLALYWVLQESVELRQAPFFGWIQNLSAPDPLYILPILNAIAMLIAQRLAPTAPGMDPTQAKIMKFMPLIFAASFAFAPAGLTLYWAANGWLGLIQQILIERRFSGEKTAATR
ncbi:membrane protein insertase YidC [Rudaea sp.]|uniref:membrane protein insertase YidC n=1 Tax=Rudaea sp. TaxID=2136325 RepID=UPI0037846468